MNQRRIKAESLHGQECGSTTIYQESIRSSLNMKTGLEAASTPRRVTRSQKPDFDLTHETPFIFPGHYSEN